MFGELRQFIGEVLHFWADWSTGGVLVLAIALVRLLKDQDFRKKTWWAFFIFFLLMGFFSAWEEQKQNRVAAETDRDFFKNKLEYSQQRIDKLSDTLLTSTNKSVVSTSFESENNSGNIANLQNSPNANLSQSIINTSPPPRISDVRLGTINIPSTFDGVHAAFETTFALIIEYPPQGAFSVAYKPIHGLVKEPILELTFSGSSFGGNAGAIPAAGYKITFLTYKKVAASDFGEWIILPKKIP